MSYVYYNPNPKNTLVGDCVIRAISKTLDQDWDKTYIDICIEGLLNKDMPSSNSVWGTYLSKSGLFRHAIPNTCPDCYTVSDFTNANREGKYILCTGAHVIAVEDGNYYDTWDSGDEIPMYYWSMEE